MQVSIQGELSDVRLAMSTLPLSSRVEPNELIHTERAFFPDGHRGVLDLKRQLVVGNRGMGKSFWTHALLNDELRQRLAHVYSFPTLARAKAAIGFNGATKVDPIAPTIDQIAQATASGYAAENIWRAVFMRAVYSLEGKPETDFFELLRFVDSDRQAYSNVLSSFDDLLFSEGRSLIVIFDALDRLAQDWQEIRALTTGLLVTVLGLQSFRSIRAKVFMRVDQFSDTYLFRFPDSSKLKNDRVDLAWRSHELYGLLLFELLRESPGREAIMRIARQTGTEKALPETGRIDTFALEDQATLIQTMAGEFMGGHKKRGRVYTWVPLHLSDAANNCSPRTFTTAWRSAAEHIPPPTDRVVDHLGLIEGVRQASSARLAELGEDYPWIDAALAPLKGQFVPIAKDELFELWANSDVSNRIMSDARQNRWLSPIGLFIEDNLETLLQTMTSIAVMEERANGKINVPDIFRVEAGVKRRGGVAVPRKN